MTKSCNSSVLKEYGESKSSILKKYGGFESSILKDYGGLFLSTEDHFLKL